MRTKTLSSWLAAGALLTTVFASGCQINVESIPHPPQAIPHPPQETKDAKDGPVRRRHHRHHHRHHTTSGQFGEPAPITHPGG